MWNSYFLFGYVVDKDQERFKLRNYIKNVKGNETGTEWNNQQLKQHLDVYFIWNVYSSVKYEKSFNYLTNSF